ncbi:MAG: putative mycofactocin radical SAM maturase MftC [Phycisphaerae bacterium]|nr:putative mycofactocin radical SAM maturase MftC [Phycisphaerae bacterium]
MNHEHPHATRPGGHPGGHPGGGEKGQAHQLRLVFWEATAGCNLECRHCRRLDVSSQLSHDDLTTEQARAMISAIRQAGTPILVFSGGEPLMRPDIFELAEYARDIGLPTALASNGTLIDEAMAARIAASGIRRVSVSLDGADEATHDYLRMQEGSFAKAVQGLRHLKSAGLQTQINCTVARHNVDQLDRMYELALELEADAMHLFMLVPVGCGAKLPEEDMLSAAKYEEVLNWLYDRSREGKLFVKATCAPHYYRIIRQRAAAEGVKLEMASHGMSAMTRGCLAGEAICFVSHKGEVFPCGYLPVEAGDVTAEPFADIWNDSDVFNRLRDLGELGGKCGPCEFKKVCMGCRARAYYATGDYMQEEPYCEFVPTRLRPEK